MAEAIANASQAKPVRAHVEGEASSAAYWAASQATAVYASKGSLVGSIGVYLAVADYKAADELDGVKVHLVTTGKYKGLGVPGTEITEEHIAHLQELVDSYHADFKAAVVAGRNGKISDIEAVSDGRVFRENDAVKNGLIDGIQNFQKTYTDMLDEVKKTSAKKAVADRLAAARLDAHKARARRGMMLD
jgi:protease-4